MKNTSNLERYLEYLEKRKMAKGSIIYYISILKKINSENIDINEIVGVITSDKLKGSSQQLYKIIFNGFLSFLEKKEELKFLKLIRLKKPQLEYMKVLEKEFVYQTCERKSKDNYEIQIMKIIAKFLFETGIRVSELSTLEIKNNKLFVNGKGNKKRQIFFVEDTLEQLNSFFPELKIKISYRTLLRDIKERFGHDVSFHTFRRSFATYMLKNGAEIKTVMLQMGHSNMQTTYRYVHLDEQYNQQVYRRFFS